MERARWGGQAPSLRMIFDLADLEGALYVMSAGQSGHFTSAHYDDLQHLWLRNEYIGSRPPCRL